MNKFFSHFDACLTTGDDFNRVHAIYDVEILPGLWKKSWCRASTYIAEIDEDIEAELLLNKEN